MISRRKARIGLALILLLTAVLPTLPAAERTARAAPSEGFADSQIRAIWARDDQQVASGSIKRAWMWGPGPFYTDYEPLSGSPQGNHLVQYFDKGRLEVNDPEADQSSPWYVTSGLLVKELVAGKAETGNGQWYNIGPANVAVTGDGGNTTAPTYAQFADLTNRVFDLTSQPISGKAYLKRNGDKAESASLPTGVPPLALTHFEDASGHNWAAPFWDFVNSSSRPGMFSWLYTLGYPITEPYWVTAPVNGEHTLLLVQLFERRTLTYNPGNPEQTRVEMGNVGRHYFDWRYGDRHGAHLGTKYDATITVGAAPKRVVQVEETITFTNTTGTPLERIVLRAPWNHWKDVFDLTGLQVNGANSENAWRYGLNLEAHLAAPIAAGSAATVKLTATLTPRPVGGRTGYDKTNDILALGDMLPTVVPFENGGWQYYPYSELGDLGNNASATYNITIQSAGTEKLVVGGTGKTVERSAGGSRWRFEASNVRDVAYVVSPHFISPWEDASMTRQEGDVKMLAFYLPAHREAGKRQLALTGPGLAWFGSNIGAYPFDTYTIAEMGVPLERTDNYAQEYPMTYFIPTNWLGLDTSPPSWTWYIPVHEVGHQWFYSTVGNNQLTDPWLDEAMTSYVTAEYVRANFPSYYAAAFADMSGGATTAKPVSAGVYSGFANESQYTAAIYDTGVAMLDKVRKEMGNADFYAALQDYYATYKFERATPADLIDMFKKHTKADLGSIFATYLVY